MKTGDIVLIPFPFAESKRKKVRPSIVIGITNDKFKDLIVCAVSSVVPEKITKTQMMIFPSSVNKLRSVSLIRVDRIVTLPVGDIITKLGSLTRAETTQFKKIFKSLVD